MLKPVDLAIESRWRASILDTLPESGAYRVARPVRARSGDWLHGGWEAARHAPGRTDPGRWDEVIEAGAAFHAALADVACPAFLDEREDPWSRADRLSWDLSPLEGDPLLRPLGEARVPVAVEHRLVHGDLLGNVLFEPGLPPTVIDWAPYRRPASWAAAVAVVDAMCWHGAGAALPDRWAGLEAWPQMLLRALLFRMITDREAGRGARREWQPRPAYRPVAAALPDRAESR